MKELYQKLFQSCEKLQGFHHAAHFVAMKGKYYDTERPDDTFKLCKHQAPRQLLIARRNVRRPSNRQKRA